MLKTRNLKLAAIIVSSAVSLAFFAETTNAHASEITVEKMVALTNDSREDAGLKPLAVNDKLAMAAQQKARHMLANQYFEHTSPDGVTPWYWFNAVEYDYTYAAENLAIDFTTAEGAHSAFMKSAGHRENILGEIYKEIGIAVISGIFEGRDTTIIVEEFGTSKEQTRQYEAFFDKPEYQNVYASATNAPKTEIVADYINTNNVSNPCDMPDGCNSENLIDENNSGKDLNDNKKGANYGKIAPEVYIIRDMGALKKVYVQNIYWKNAGNNDYLNALESYKARLKSMLQDWTDGKCCKPRITAI